MCGRGEKEAQKATSTENKGKNAPYAWESKPLVNKKLGIASPTDDPRPNSSTQFRGCLFGEGTLIFRREEFCRVIAKAIARGKDWGKLVYAAPSGEILQLQKQDITGTTTLSYELMGFKIFQVKPNPPYNLEVGETIWVCNAKEICNGGCP